MVVLWSLGREGGALCGVVALASLWLDHTVREASAVEFVQGLVLGRLMSCPLVAVPLASKPASTKCSGNSWGKHTLIKGTINKIGASVPLSAIIATVITVCVEGMCANIPPALREFSSADGSPNWHAQHSGLNLALEAAHSDYISTYNEGAKEESGGNPIGLVHSLEHLWAGVFFCCAGGFTGFADFSSTGHILVSGSWTPCNVLAISAAGMICNRMIGNSGDPSDTLLSTYLRIATILPEQLRPTSPADMLSKAQLARIV